MPQTEKFSPKKIKAEYKKKKKLWAEALPFFNFSQWRSKPHAFLRLLAYCLIGSLAGFIGAWVAALQLSGEGSWMKAATSAITVFFTLLTLYAVSGTLLRRFFFNKPERLKQLGIPDEVAQEIKSERNFSRQRELFRPFAESYQKSLKRGR